MNKKYYSIEEFKELKEYSKEYNNIKNDLKDFKKSYCFYIIKINKENIALFVFDKYEYNINLYYQNEIIIYNNFDSFDYSSIEKNLIDEYYLKDYITKKLEVLK